MTFEEIGIYFTVNSSCITCKDHSCHNTAILKSNGAEYNVHISTDLERTEFCITATLDSNTDTSNDIIRIFYNENDAAKFVCNTFEWTGCF